MNFLINSAHAQEAAAAGAQSPIASLIPFALVFVVFYFLMIKPQKKKLDEEKTFLSALKKGDEIFTKSGIIGVVHGITDSIVTLEVNDGVKFKILKSQVAGNASTIFNANNKDQKTAENKTDKK